MTTRSLSGTGGSYASGDENRLLDGPSEYQAFICCTQGDKLWAAWLQKALESFRVPAALVGRVTTAGRIAARLSPIFRDGSEVSESDDLGQKIRNAILSSRCMIVICSPRAAASRWIREEVLTFKRGKHADRLLCLIVDGEPNASDKPESPQRECFPDAVRYALGADGKPSAVRAEPIAADVRPGQGSRGDALLKIVAGIIGVGFDELAQRNTRRRRQRLLFLALTTAGAAVAMAGFARHQILWGRRIEHMPFPRMSNRYSADELRRLGDERERLFKARERAELEFKVGIVGGLDAARAGYAWRMCEAELAWAQGDLTASRDHLKGAVAEADRMVEIGRLRFEMGFGKVDEMIDAENARSIAALALGHLRAILGTPADAKKP